MFLSSMWDDKEPTHYWKRVGREVSRCCGCPLCRFFWVGASHRDNLMHLSHLDRNVQGKNGYAQLCGSLRNVCFDIFLKSCFQKQKSSDLLLSAHINSIMLKKLKISKILRELTSCPTRDKKRNRN